jgi:hypothetical protein
MNDLAAFVAAAAALAQQPPFVRDVGECGRQECRLCIHKYIVE